VVYKTVNVREETLERLEDARQSQRGARNETLDSVINRALDCLERGVKDVV
jgi:hypothetical protein